MRSSASLLFRNHGARRGMVTYTHFMAGSYAMPMLTSVRYSSSQNHRIYTSDLDSILPHIENEKTMYSYIMKRIKAADPAKVATVQTETGQKLTYGELGPTVERVAQILYHKGGVRKGDVVCIAMLNTFLYGPLLYGTMRLGGIVSTVNAVAAPGTLAYHLKTNKAKIVLGMRFFQKPLEAAVEIVKKETGQTVTIYYPEDFLKITDKLDIPADYVGFQDGKPDDTVFIPFSSGTTGLPKGVQLTNRNLMANCEQSGHGFSMNSNDVTVAVLPFFHIFGFTCCVNSVFAFNATQVVMMKYTVESYLEATQKFKATVNLVAPPILVSLLKNEEKVKKCDLSSLKVMRSGSAPLGAELEVAIEKLLPGVTVGQGYGMTEMSPVVAALSRNYKSREHGSCGSIAPDTEFRFVRVDDTQQSGEDRSEGVDVAPGEDGEVWLRGPQLMKGYLNDKDTGVCMQDGWYRTGDIGHFNTETRELVITDRLKELIKYKGFQVSPASLEGALLTHPWVHDCIVIGVPDPRDVSFEMPRALVVLKPDLPAKDAVCASDTLYRFIMGIMPPHKRLHGGVRIVEAVPRNPSGKLMRRQARQEEVELLKSLSQGTSASSSTG